MSEKVMIHSFLFARLMGRTSTTGTGIDWQCTVPCTVPVCYCTCTRYFVQVVLYSTPPGTSTRYLVALTYTVPGSTCTITW